MSYVSTNINTTGESFRKVRKFMSKYELTDVFVEMTDSTPEMSFYRNEEKFLNVSTRDFNILSNYLYERMKKHDLAGIDFRSDDGDFDMDFHFDGALFDVDLFDVSPEPPLCCLSNDAYNEYVKGR